MTACLQEQPNTTAISARLRASARLSTPFYAQSHELSQHVVKKNIRQH